MEKFASASDITLSVTGRRWQLRAPVRSDMVPAALARGLGLSDTVASLLLSREALNGHDDPILAAGRFLSPQLADLPDPDHLLDMPEAVARLMQAVQENEKIAVFGDYDVDGSCAAALLLRYLRALGADPLLYIPDRLTEGYGPNPGAMEKLAQAGTKLIITVDCGSLAFAAMEKAAACGMDILITDHHKTRPEKPLCSAFINPNRADETSPCGMLCGAGVAFYLAMATNRTLRRAGFFKNRSEPDLKPLLALVGLATLCDMVPLTGVNRVLAFRGLQALGALPYPGLQALAQAAGITETVDAYHAGFVLGPRINAGGRIDACDLGARLLASDNIEECQAIAARLDTLNDERRAIEQAVCDEAFTRLSGGARDDEAVIVVAGEGWHPGVVGIVASRVKEKFHRPAFVLGIEGGLVKGSGRSIPGLDIGRAVMACDDLIEAGGGHTMAAGLTVRKENLAALTRRLNENFLEQANKAAADVFTPALNIDAALAVSAVTETFMASLAQLAPFGAGHGEPRFVFSGIRVSGARTVGADGRHVMCRLEGVTGGRLDAIAFKAMESELGPFLLAARGPVSVAGYLKKETWQGTTRHKLHLTDAFQGAWQA